MKQIKFLILAILFLGCTKEDPIETPPAQCNCGVIANDGITGSCYWLEIISDCSGNKKQFCFDQNVWMDNHVGDHFCVTNESGW